MLAIAPKYVLVDGSKVWCDWKSEGGSAAKKAAPKKAGRKAR
jgi:hypothetical protein